MHSKATNSFMSFCCTAKHSGSTSDDNCLQGWKEDVPRRRQAAAQRRVASHANKQSGAPRDARESDNTGTADSARRSGDGQVAAVRLSTRFCNVSKQLVVYVRNVTLLAKPVRPVELHVTVQRGSLKLKGRSPLAVQAPPDCNASHDWAFDLSRPDRLGATHATLLLRLKLPHRRKVVAVAAHDIPCSQDYHCATVMLLPTSNSAFLPLQTPPTEVSLSLPRSLWPRIRSTPLRSRSHSATSLDYVNVNDLPTTSNNTHNESRDCRKSCPSLPQAKHSPTRQSRRKLHSQLLLAEPMPHYSPAMSESRKRLLCYAHTQAQTTNEASFAPTSCAACNPTLNPYESSLHKQHGMRALGDALATRDCPLLLRNENAHAHAHAHAILTRRAASAQSSPASHPQRYRQNAYMLHRSPGHAPHNARANPYAPPTTSALLDAACRPLRPRLQAEPYAYSPADNELYQPGPSSQPNKRDDGDEWWTAFYSAVADFVRIRDPPPTNSHTQLRAVTSASPLLLQCSTSEEQCSSLTPAHVQCFHCAPSYTYPQNNVLSVNPSVLQRAPARLTERYRLYELATAATCRVASQPHDLLLSVPAQSTDPTCNTGTTNGAVCSETHQLIERPVQRETLGSLLNSPFLSPDRECSALVQSLHTQNDQNTPTLQSESTKNPALQMNAQINPLLSVTWLTAELHADAYDDQQLTLLVQPESPKCACLVTYAPAGFLHASQCKTQAPDVRNVAHASVSHNAASNYCPAQFASSQHSHSDAIMPQLLTHTDQHYESDPVHVAHEEMLSAESADVPVNASLHQQKHLSNLIHSPASSGKDHLFHSTPRSTLQIQLSGESDKDVPTETTSPGNDIGDVSSVSGARNSWTCSTDDAADSAKETTQQSEGELENECREYQYSSSPRISVHLHFSNDVPNFPAADISDILPVLPDQLANLASTSSQDGATTETLSNQDSKPLYAQNESLPRSAMTVCIEIDADRETPTLSTVPFGNMLQDALPLTAEGTECIYRSCRLNSVDFSLDPSGRPSAAPLFMMGDSCLNKLATRQRREGRSEEMQRPYAAKSGAKRRKSSVLSCPQTRCNLDTVSFSSRSSVLTAADSVSSGSSKGSQLCLTLQQWRVSSSVSEMSGHIRQRKSSNLMEFSFTRNPMPHLQLPKAGCKSNASAGGESENDDGQTSWTSNNGPPGRPGMKLAFSDVCGSVSVGLLRLSPLTMLDPSERMRDISRKLKEAAVLERHSHELQLETTRAEDSSKARSSKLSEIESKLVLLVRQSRHSLGANSRPLDAELEAVEQEINQELAVLRQECLKHFENSSRSIAAAASILVGPSSGMLTQLQAHTEQAQTGLNSLASPQRSVSVVQRQGRTVKSLAALNYSPSFLTSSLRNLFNVERHYGYHGVNFAKPSASRVGTNAIFFGSVKKDS